MLTTTDFDPIKRVHQLTAIFEISGFFMENENKFLINFLIITHRVKFIHSLRTPYNLF